MFFFIGVFSFIEVMKMGFEIYYILKKVIIKKYGIDVVNVGDEGGFVFNVFGVEEFFEFFIEVIKQVGYIGKVQIGFDVVFFEFFKDGKYDFDFKVNYFYFFNSV